MANEIRGHRIANNRANANAQLTTKPKLGGGNALLAAQHTLLHQPSLSGQGFAQRGAPDTNQFDNTLIIFTSDNGGERFSDNWPLVGGKMDLTEGGIRVPYIAHWPEGLKQSAGQTSTQHCLTMDWSATILDIAGVQAAANQPLDGQSLLGNLHTPANTVARPMFWRMKHRDQRAYRLGSWKYLKVDTYEYLFDIDTDARERANQAKRQPQRLRAMRAAYEAWNAQIPAVPDDARIGLVFSVADMPSR